MRKYLRYADCVRRRSLELGESTTNKEVPFAKAYHEMGKTTFIDAKYLRYADCVRRRSPGLGESTTNKEVAFAKASATEGGKRGIRTLGTVARTTVFETVPFDHSGIFPFFKLKINIFFST